MKQLFILIALLAAALLAPCGCKSVDDSTVSGPKTVQLRNYEIASPVMERIIDDVIIHGIDSCRYDNEHIVLLDIKNDEGIDILYAQSWEIDACYDYITADYGYFSRNNHKFLVITFNKNYFKRNRNYSEFKYTYEAEIEEADEIAWMIEIADNSYSVLIEFGG